jgi:poly-gamma-glutamate capsule biosynthesis protein CapA/YwtB (metallophosphatase superfamily)
MDQGMTFVCRVRARRIRIAIAISIVPTKIYKNQPMQLNTSKEAPLQRGQVTALQTCWRRIFDAVAGNVQENTING